MLNPDFFHTFAYHIVWYYKNDNMKKVEKKQWFVIGLQIIENNGVAKITIDNLCNLLEITKGAFWKI